MGCSRASPAVRFYGRNPVHERGRLMAGFLSSPTFFAAAVRAAPDLTAIFVLSARPGRRSERDRRERTIRDPSVRSEGPATRQRRFRCSCVVLPGRRVDPGVVI